MRRASVVTFAALARNHSVMLRHPPVRSLAGLLLAGAALAAPAAAAAQAGGARPLSLAETGSVRPDVDTVTLAGRALVGSGVLHDRALYLSVATGGRGIWLYSRNARALRVEPGDSVEATGVLHSYRGTLEVVASQVRVLPGPRPAPTTPREQPAGASSVVA